MDRKKLLLLGGQKKMCEIVEKARGLGYYTIVTDWYADSPAKRLADEAWDISIADTDALAARIADRKIDGVFTAFIDSYLEAYRALCEKAQLPCAMNRKVVQLCVNKRRFKEHCASYGIETIPTYPLSETLSREELEALEYPVLLKPVDNSGSKGISVCSDSREVPEAYRRALRFSKERDVMAERFLTCDYVVAYYIIRQGEPRLAMLLDKDMNRIGRGLVPYPAAVSTPSRYDGRYKQAMDEKVCRMLRDLNIPVGTVHISFFVSGSHYYGVEMTARVAATREHIFYQRQTGEDVLAMQLQYAVTGRMEPVVCASPVSSAAVYTQVFLFVREGTIAKVEGLDALWQQRGVQDVLQLRKAGDSIRSDGSYGQLLARIWLEAENEREMIRLVDTVQSAVRAEDANGRSMLLHGFEAGRFFR